MNDTSPAANHFSGAQWIRKSGAEASRNLYLQLLKSFVLDAPRAATLHITAVSQFQVWLNGELIGRGPAVGFQTRYYYHSYALAADQLKAGENRIAVLLFHDGHNTETIQGFQYGDPGLLLALEGLDTPVVTDPSWLVRRAPEYSGAHTMVSQWGGYKEFYHGDRVDAWQSTPVDAADWEAAIAIAPPESPEFVQKLVPLDVPFLEEQEIRPQSIVDLSPNLGTIRLSDGTELGQLPVAWTEQEIHASCDAPFAAPSITLDLGDMWVGYPEITTTGGRAIIELWYGESLDLYRLDVLDLPVGTTWRAFQRRSYRYMKLVFVAVEGAVAVQRIGHGNAWYAFNRNTRLECSEPSLQRMVDVSRQTLRADSSYHYEDCPVREQALWIMDMRVMALINVYLYGNTELTAKCLRQAFALQRADGSIASTGPKDNNMFHHDFMLHLVATLKDHYEHTGDHEIVAELWPQLLRLESFIRTFQAKNGLLDSTLEERAHPYLDWSTKIEKLGQSSILNALFKCYLEDMALLAEATAMADPAAYRKEANHVKQTVNALLFDSNVGLYRDTYCNGELLEGISQQANMASIYAGICPDERIADVLDKVWYSGDYPRPFGPSFYVLIVDALHRVGKQGALPELFDSYWGEMLRRGATTWWEVFDPTTPEWSYPHPFLGNTPTHELDWIPISACHGWSGIPGYSIPRHLLGVDLSQVHANRIVVDPGIPGLIKSVRYAVPVRGSLLDLSFEGDGERYQITVHAAPEGLELILPENM